MEKVMELLTAYWWTIPLVLAVISYKWVLRVLFGMVIVPEDKIGLVTKKFVLFGKNKDLPDGRIIALNGEAGYQADGLPPGLKWWYWIWQYSIDMVDFTDVPAGKIGLVVAKDGKELPVGNILARRVESDSFTDARKFLDNGGFKGKQVEFLNAGKYRINRLLFDVINVDVKTIEEGQVGIITAADGIPLTKGQIAGTEVLGHNNFQDFNSFLANGGQRGLQTQIILAGSYSINPWAVKIESVPMQEVPIGHVGIVISYVGEEGKDITGDGFKHGNIVDKGQKGVWAQPLDPGKYPINTYTHKIQTVPTTNLVLNWADARTESHNLDKNLSTITVRSKDGFQFNLDVSQIIHIPSTDAPKVIARFGSVQNLVSQVLEPTIGNYFRNSAQSSDVIAFLSSRQERQESAKDRISEVLAAYNVHAVDTLIGDINPPDSLMKTLTDRKIAEQEQVTYETQMMAQKIRQKLESETALANMQGEIVTAQQSVQIAERKADVQVKGAEGQAKSIEISALAQANATKITAEAEAFSVEAVGKAEASKIENIGKANATAYSDQVAAMGADNFGKLKITEAIGTNHIEIIPKVLITGGNENSNPMSGLLGLQLMNMMGPENVVQAAKEQVKTKTK